MTARTPIIAAGPTIPAPAWLDALQVTLAAEGGTSAPVLVDARGVRHSRAVRVNAAAEAADGDRVLVLAGAVLPAPEAAAALLLANMTRPGLTLAGPSNLLDDWTLRLTDDFASAAAEAAAQVFAGAPGDPLPEVSVFAMGRAALAGLGGLDQHLDGVGEIIDLALRALDAGLPVEIVPIAGEPLSQDTAGAPTDPAHALLSWRNAALIALRRADPTDAGALLGLVATRAVAAAWRAAGLDPASLRFGGDWARQATLDRLLGRAGVTRNATFWPREEVGSLVPLLGLDAALDRLVAGWPPRTASPRAKIRESGTASAAAGTADLPDGRVDTLANDAPAATTATPARPPSGPDGTVALPLVSVIVVNWNGEPHLEACFSSIAASDWPADRLDVICVDNGSTDGSRALMASRFPAVRVVALPENRGFTGGNSAGVAQARGDVLVFLNNDMRVEPDAIRRLVAAIDARHPCTAARVLSWDGRRLDFVRGTISFEARGFQEHYGEAVRPELSAAGESFFPNGGAFAITRDAYERAGGFDDRFFAYYDDIDLGWGVRLAGGHVRVVPEAVVYHRHGATSRLQPRGQKQFLMERNAIWTATKRYGDRALRHSLGAMLLLAVRRIVQDCGFDRRSPSAQAIAPWTPRIGSRARRDAADRRHGRPPSVAPGRFLRRCPVESLAAIGEAVRALPAVVADRHRLAPARTTPDRDVLPRFGRALECLSSRTSYVRAHEALVARLDLARVFRQRTRVLVITHEPLRQNMSGPGVRALELGRALASHCLVTVATPFPPDIGDDRCRLAQYSFTAQAPVRALAQDADVVVLQGFTLARFPSLARLPLKIVVDLYCPFTIEHLEMRTSAMAGGGPGAMDMDAILAEARPVLLAQNEQLEAGDFFLCASERQRDFWIGALQTAGRVNARTYADDPTLRSLIDVVPFGLPDDPPPPPARAVMRGVLPGIGPRDRIVLWAGSILDWQDPQNLVRAIALIARRRPDVKLVFMGTRHPNPDVPPMRAVEETIAIARDLGVLDTHVVFNPWVPYAERHLWLQEADLGVSTHRDHLETRLSYRTRMLDYFWAALPIVCTRGDVFAGLVEARGLGLTVPPEDVPALAAAIETLLDDLTRREASRAALRVAAAEMRWGVVTAPLLRFCLDPRHAADRLPGMQAVRARLERKYRLSKWLKRTALALGMSEGLIERVKQAPPVRAALVWRNRLALARAQRGP